MNDLLFVYGTLRQGNTNVMALHLAQQADFCAYGWFQGLMYQIGFYPGVVVSNDHCHRVYGEVYRLRDVQRVLSMLDEYEECSARHRQPAEYKRVQTQILTMDGRLLEPVWIYLYQWSLADKVRIVTGDFMRQTQTA